ncbi:hypothetical protein WICMUC_004757 [Wickerhamomyces mucosus]|uniref:Uncharacterized protein n=1 Tax=Wickerhamomyces mucosus TaxID=1378264 RepID=A0A9P8TAE0_9ASCO|nr:hypothetical protein WICMUC_004757 [Wickerhamomyces mucosus]
MVPVSHPKTIPPNAIIKHNKEIKMYAEAGLASISSSLFAGASLLIEDTSETGLDFSLPLHNKVAFKSFSLVMVTDKL